jgi:hypothetical protein
MLAAGAAALHAGGRQTAARREEADGDVGDEPVEACGMPEVQLS